MPVVNGRLTCCTCGADLGDAEDQYRDPDCMDCFNAHEDALEREREEAESIEASQERIADALDARDARDFDDHSLDGLSGGEHWPQYDSPAALRRAAEAIEHGAEYNDGETLRWTPEERAANNRAITRARALRDQADGMEERNACPVNDPGCNGGEGDCHDTCVRNMDDPREQEGAHADAEPGRGNF